MACGNHYIAIILTERIVISLLASDVLRLTLRITLASPRSNIAQCHVMSYAVVFNRVLAVVALFVHVIASSARAEILHVADKTLHNTVLN